LYYLSDNTSSQAEIGDARQRW